MSPADPDRGKASKSPTENKVGEGLGRSSHPTVADGPPTPQKAVFNLRKMHILLAT